jgi:4-carboxymuconolactone decarboxylase
MTDDPASAGQALRTKMFGDAFAARPLDFPEWDRLTKEVLFGRVWSRPDLDLRTRSLCQVAALTVLNRPDALRHHLGAALRNGATAAELQEVILQMGFYGGWPCAASAFPILAQILGQIDGAATETATESP